jgi:hypothetical protein
LRVFWFSGESLTEGIEDHKIDEVKVKIYRPGKTAADCFKFRNRIGMDVAIEALKLCRERPPSRETFRQSRSPGGMRAEMGPGNRALSGTRSLAAPALRHRQSRHLTRTPPGKKPSLIDYQYPT